MPEPTSASLPPPLPESAANPSAPLGVAIDAGRGRVFPCEKCGAELTFNIGGQNLTCPHCGHIQALHFDSAASLQEQDFHAMLDKISAWRQAGIADEQGTSEVRCAACGGTVVFIDSLTSSECPYCGVPLQREQVHLSPQRVPVDGVLPFQIVREQAAQRLKAWVASRWFAPNEFLKQGASGKFSGVYLPFWTYDTLTANAWSGRRGDDYTVTVGSGKDRHTETRTDWTTVSGHFQRFFDDVLIFAARGFPDWMMRGLEPWRLEECVPFNQELLAGLLARTYDIPLDRGFEQARQRIEETLTADVRERIGGDHQEVEQIDTRYFALTYKHLLLPVWLLAYRYHARTYQVAINASTGEVQGERPYSPWKITLAVLALLLAAVGIYYFFFEREPSVTIQRHPEFFRTFMR